MGSQYPPKKIACRGKIIGWILKRSTVSNVWGSVVVRLDWPTFQMSLSFCVSQLAVCRPWTLVRFDMQGWHKIRDIKFETTTLVCQKQSAHHMTGQHRTNASPYRQLPAQTQFVELRKQHETYTISPRSMETNKSSCACWNDRSDAEQAWSTTTYRQKHREAIHIDLSYMTAQTKFTVNMPSRK